MLPRRCLGPRSSGDQHETTSTLDLTVAVRGCEFLFRWSEAVVQRLPTRCSRERADSRRGNVVSSFSRCRAQLDSRRTAPSAASLLIVLSVFVIKQDRLICAKHLRPATRRPCVTCLLALIAGPFLFYRDSRRVIDATESNRFVLSFIIVAADRRRYTETIAHARVRVFRG